MNTAPSGRTTIATILLGLLANGCGCSYPWLKADEWLNTSAAIHLGDDAASRPHQKVAYRVFLVRSNPKPLLEGGALFDWRITSDELAKADPKGNITPEKLKPHCDFAFQGEIESNKDIKLDMLPSNWKQAPKHLLIMVNFDPKDAPLEPEVVKAISIPVNSISSEQSIYLSEYRVQLKKPGPYRP